MEDVNFLSIVCCCALSHLLNDTLLQFFFGNDYNHPSLGVSSFLNCTMAVKKITTSVPDLCFMSYKFNISSSFDQ